MLHATMRVMCLKILQFISTFKVNDFQDLISSSKNFVSEASYIYFDNFTIFSSFQNCVLKMITANLAGTTHLRADRHRDSSNSHSRLNLADLDSEIATAEANLNKYNLENPNGSDSLCNGAEDTEAQKLQGILNDYRRKKCLRDCYKNWGFLACVACVLIGTIVLIVLLATGIISLDAS